MTIQQRWLLVTSIIIVGCGNHASESEPAQPILPNMTQPQVETRSNVSTPQIENDRAAGSGKAASPPAVTKAPAAMPSAGNTAQQLSVDAGTRMPRDDADSGSAAALRSLCSGCPAEKLDLMDMSLHLHHIHLNVANRERSTQFYEKYFHAERVMLNSVTPAVHVAPTLILMEERGSAPDAMLPTALQHMGWGSKDPGAWYMKAHAQGIAPDTRGFTSFNTNDTPTISTTGDTGLGALFGPILGAPACFPVPDAISYMYVLGPDQERIEVWSGVDGRVNHVHFTTADLNATANWYNQFLGLAGSTALDNYAFFLDDIVFYYEPIGAAADYKPTDDRVLGHIALSVTDLDAWRKRATDNKVQIVSEPAAAHGWKSFFVRGPDGLLIELVQAAKLAELCPP